MAEKKRMFVVMEVKQASDEEDRVYPIDAFGPSDEGINKSRVIYADEVDVVDFTGCVFSHDNRPSKRIWFRGISPSHDPKDEWEEWINDMPEYFSDQYWSERRELTQDWLRKIPTKR